MHKQKRRFNHPPASREPGAPTKAVQGFWELASLSRRAWYGGGFMALGVLLLAFVAYDVWHGEPYDDSKRFLTGECILLLLAGAGAIASGINQVHWWQRLQARGQETQATVIKVRLARMQPQLNFWEVYLKRPRDAVYIVRYEYHDHRGTIHRGRSGYLADLGLKPGDRVRILYDLEHPEKSLWADHGPAASLRGTASS
jgi:Protein of unknown function (DUF3592)